MGRSLPRAALTLAAAWLFSAALLEPAGCAGAAPPRDLPDLPGWVRSHVGVAFHAKREEGDVCTMPELIALAEQLGTPGALVWVAGAKPGALVRSVQTEDCLRVLRRFRFVKLNLCQAYLGLDYDYNTRPMTEVLADVERDWHETTRAIVRELRGQPRTVMLCYGQELNVYFGRQDNRPDFPVVDYVAAGHRGMTRALEEAGPLGALEVFDLAEVQFALEFEQWVDRFVPKLPADLFGLTYYPNGLTLTDQLEYLAARIPATSRFGHRGIVLSETGETLEQVYWDEGKQLAYLRDILGEARAWGVPYAFWFQLADTDFVLRVAGYCGLIGHRDDPVPRLAWDYLRAVYQGVDPPTVPPRDPRETMASVPLFRKGLTRAGAFPDLIVSRLEWQPGEPRAGERVEFTVAVKNIGSAPTPPWIEATGEGAILADLEVDGHFVGYGMATGPLPVGGEVSLELIRWSPRAFWKATPGRHTITAGVNAKRLVPEGDHSPASNTRSRECVVPG